MTMQNRLTFGQKLSVWNLLDKVCHSDTDGFAFFDEGLNDHIVADQCTDQLGFAVIASHIAGLRRKMIGNFRSPIGSMGSTVSGNRAELIGRIAALEKSTEAIAESQSSVVTSQAEVVEMIENFRRVMSGHGQKIEAIRKVVEVAGAHQLESIYRVKDRIAPLIKENRLTVDDLFKQMRGEGFSEDATQSALVLLGAVMRDQLVFLPHDDAVAEGLQNDDSLSPSEGTEKAETA